MARVFGVSKGHGGATSSVISWRRPAARRSTGGGEGQVFEYNPFAETIKLIYNSLGAADCENPDNLTVTPRGGLLLCEDNSGGTPNDAERLLGLTFNGGIFTFAKNNVMLASAYNSVVPAGDYRQIRMGRRLLQP